MKRFKYGLSLLALAACALFAGACNDDETEGVDVVETTRVKEIGYRSAVCVGYVKGVCSERGVCYFDAAAPDRVLTLKAPQGGDAFEVALPDLETGHDYSCYVYARAGGLVVKGEVKTFRTLEEGEPYLLAGEALNVEHTTATLEGYVFTGGGSEIQERGFCYGPVDDPSLDDEQCTTVSVEGGLGQMTADLTGLADKTDYSVRIYIRNGEGLYYSPVTTFRTRQYNKPGVSIVGFERRGDKIAVRAKTSVQDPADEELATSCGICVGNTDVYEQGTEYTASATGIGEYEVEIAANGNVGYIWAWASNKEGKEISNVATSRASVRLEADMDVRSRWMAPTFTIENLGIFDADITEAGVCWSETGTDPTVANDHKAYTAEGSLVPATYEMPLFFGLKTATAYRVRAYVTNQYGTSYSKAVEITTAPDLFDTHARVTGSGGSAGPDFNAWQIILNDVTNANNANVPESCLSPAFLGIYRGWDTACTNYSGYYMNGIIYQLTAQSDNTFTLKLFFYYRQSNASKSLKSFTSAITCQRNDDNTFQFTAHTTPAGSTADIYNKSAADDKLKFDQVFDYFADHRFYLEWGVPRADFEALRGTTSGGSENKTSGPIWMVPVDEPQNYWTFTEKHYK